MCCICMYIRVSVWVLVFTRAVVNTLTQVQITLLKLCRIHTFYLVPKQDSNIYVTLRTCRQSSKLGWNAIVVRQMQPSNSIIEFNKEVPLRGIDRWWWSRWRTVLNQEIAERILSISNFQVGITTGRGRYLQFVKVKQHSVANWCCDCPSAERHSLMIPWPEPTVWRVGSVQGVHTT